MEYNIEELIKVLEQDLQEVKDIYKKAINKEYSFVCTERYRLLKTNIETLKEIQRLNKEGS